LTTRAAPLIAVVGVCASGKSTLAEALRGRGHNARQVLQEHSYVPHMWQRITRPDILIYLDCSPATTRARRNSSQYPDWITREERHRLRHARMHCDIYLNTDALTPAQVLAFAEDQLARIAARPE
jgi:thymidylate kinase